MSEYDRGAYTPNHEPDLAFDARDPHDAGRRPLPLALIGSTVVLLVLVGAVAFAYRSGVRGEGDPPRAVGKPVLAVKTVGGPEVAEPQDEAANLDVYAAQDKAAAVARAQAAPAEGVQPASASQPSFAPDPEEPTARTRAPDLPSTGNTRLAQADTVERPRPAPTAAPARPAPAARNEAETVRASPESRTEHVTAKPAKVETAHAAKTAPAVETAHGAKTAPAPAVTPAKSSDTHAARASVEPKPTPAKLAVEAKTAPVKPVAETKGPPAKSAKPATESSTAKLAAAEGDATTAKTATADTKAVVPPKTGAVVQIGAFASAALADKGWSDVSTALPSAMAGKAKRVQTVEKDGKTFYRTSVAGFASRADAVSFCEALKAKGKACFVKG